MKIIFLDKFFTKFIRPPAILTCFRQVDYPAKYNTPVGIFPKGIAVVCVFCTRNGFGAALKR